MERLSEYFTWDEVVASGTAERLDIDNSVPPELTENVQRTALKLDGVRRYLNVPILVSSWYRCPALNGLIGSKGTSQHLKGQAVDFRAPQFGPPRFIVDYLRSAPIDYDQLILEYPDGPSKGWVHISFSDSPRRQALLIDNSGTHAWT